MASPQSCNGSDQRAMPMDNWVAMAIWDPTNPESYQYVANDFGTWRSIVSAVVMRVGGAHGPVPWHRVLERL